MKPNCVRAVGLFEYLNRIVEIKTVTKLVLLREVDLRVWICYFGSKEKLMVERRLAMNEKDMIEHEKADRKVFLKQHEKGASPVDASTTVSKRELAIYLAAKGYDTATEMHEDILGDLYNQLPD